MLCIFDRHAMQSWSCCFGANSSSSTGFYVLRQQSRIGTKQSCPVCPKTDKPSNHGLCVLQKTHYISVSSSGHLSPCIPQTNVSSDPGLSDHRQTCCVVVMCDLRQDIRVDSRFVCSNADMPSIRRLCFLRHTVHPALVCVFSDSHVKKCRSVLQQLWFVHLKLDISHTHMHNVVLICVRRKTLSSQGLSVLRQTNDVVLI